MYRAPSLQFEYTVAFSGDPALNLPADPKEREHALTVARETGAWNSICHSNMLPTLFRLRRLSHSDSEWMIGQSIRRQLSGPESVTLAVRLAWRGIENCEGFEFSTLKEGERVLVTEKSIDDLADIGIPLGAPLLGRQIISEIGNEVWRCATEGIAPKR